MKIGIHLSSYTKDWSDDGLGFISHAAQTGYQAVELPLMFPECYDVWRAKRLLKEYHMECTCGTGVNAVEDPSSADEEIRGRGTARLKKCIQIAAELGADCLGGVLYTPWGMRKPRAEAVENYKWAEESIRTAADYAKKYGITLSLEILNRYESYFMNTVEEGLQFLEKVSRDNVKLHFDTFHAYIEECDIRGAILKGGKQIFHVHLCDNNRSAPGTGRVPFQEIKEALREIDYHRYLMVENFILPNTEAGNESCIWRENRADVYQNAEAAYAYVKRLFDEECS